jgi:hypothetical protein
MQRQIKLKNTDDFVLLDTHVLQELSKYPHLKEICFFKNLRMHSSGCVFFQKTYKRHPPAEGYRTETIYLHKLIAEQYLADFRIGEATLVGTLSGNKKDCRLSNLIYRSRAVASRKRKSSSKLGYTGVYRDNNRYRAVISKNRKSIHIGMFATPEEAAEAYNVKSRELYGTEGKINVIRLHGSSGASRVIQGKSLPIQPLQDKQGNQSSDSGE